MFKKYLISFILAITSLVINSQELSSYLKQVAENNPDIKSYGMLLESIRLEAKTGLTPEDPSISFGYMPGNLPEIANKKVWSVNQSFSFPTKYLMQKKVNQSTVILAEEEYNMGKMLTLLNAKLILLEILYNQKTLQVLIERKRGYDKLQDAWDKMVKYGEASILDYNKILMELSALTLNMSRTRAAISMLKNNLHYMTGNLTVITGQLEYTPPGPPDIEVLISEKINSDPAFLLPEKEFSIRNNEVKLSKTNSLPEFHIGYSSEIVPGETYAGPIAGLTIPLWSNANRIKTAETKADYYAVKRDGELERLKSELINEYSNLVALKQSIDEISEILSSGNNAELLDIALANGEISLTTYFSDLDVMFQVEDKLMELENEYNKSLAKLLSHELLLLY